MKTQSAVRQPALYRLAACAFLWVLVSLAGPAFGQTGAALSFDGTDDYVNIPHPVSSDFTVEYWMKTTAAGPAGTQWYQGNGIVDAEVPGDVNDWGTSIVGTKLAFGLGNPQATILSSSLVNTGVWVHVAATWKQSTGEMKLYINGVLESSATGPTALRNAPTRITIGEIQTNINRFNGSVDELRIWNRVLGAAEILFHKNCEIATTGTSLAANYHFNQGTGGSTNTGINTLTDASGNNRTGTLNSFALTGATSNWVTPGGVTSGTTCSTDQMIVQGNATNITDGQTVPSAANNTDFGNCDISTFLLKTYSIYNTGVNALSINNITVTGANASQFAAIGAPTTIASGGTAPITVLFVPITTGVKTATVHIDNNSNNATDFDFAVQATGVTPGAALNFDGVNDFVNIPQSFTDDFSVEYWMKTTATGPSGTAWTQGYGVVDASTAGPTNDWGTSLLGNKIAFGIGNPDVTLVSTSVVNTGSWVHVAATWKRTTGQMKLYINGVLEASGTGSVNIRSASNRITMGELQTNNNFFAGTMDELRIWTRVLTAVEIQAHEYCEVSGAVSGLTANYHFNQGLASATNTGTTLTDASGNNRTGTLNNFALTGSSSNWVVPGAVVTGTTCATTQINVQGNSADITDGQTIPSTTNATNFGTSVTNTPIVKTFSIQNIGIYALNVSSITVTGANASAFTVTNVPTTVAAMSSSSFTVSFTTATTGTFTATIHVNNDASNAGDYDFAVQAAAVPLVPASALRFDGVNDYVSIPHPVSGDFSVEYWMKTSVAGPAGTQWYQGNGIVDAEVPGVLNDWGTSIVGTRLAFGLGNPETSILSTSDVNTGNWVHVTATWKQSSGQMKLYINGVQEAINASGPTGLRDAPTRITIGELQTNISFFNGSVDELRIWNRVLTPTEILVHKDCEIAASALGLAANYHFNQGDTAVSNAGINTLTDASGNNRTGTLNAFALSGSTSNWSGPGGVISGTACTGTQVNIQGNGIDIADGQTTASAANATDFGINLLGSPLTRTFTVQNTGLAALTISGMTVTGTGTAAFTVSSLPASIALGGSATFTVTFNTATPGNYTAVVHVNSNGTNATDYDFVVAGTAIIQTPGASLSFDGINDFVSLPYIVSSDFSVEYWMKTTTTGPTGTQWTSGNGVVDAHVNGTGNDWGTSLVGSKLAFGLGNPLTTIFSASNVNTGNWVHVAFTWTRSTGQMRLFINGVQEATTTGPTNFRNSPSQITVGQLQTNTNRFNGSVDELRIWNRVLTQSEIQDHKDCEIATTATALAANYHFNQGDTGISNAAINTLIDVSGNNRTGTLNNFALSGSSSNWVAPGGVVTGNVCTSSEISIKGNNIDITDGQTIPSATNFTDFGSNSINVPATRTYTIQNTGVSLVTVSGVSFTGAQASSFSAGNVPATIAAGGSASFTVTFNGATIGAYTATAHLNSNATNAADYDFAVQGNVLLPVPASSLTFDGVDDYVSIPNVVSSDFSVEYWMKTSASGPAGTNWAEGNGIVDAEVGGLVNDWGTSLLGNKLAFGIGNPDITVVSASAVNTGNWVHVATTWKQSTGQMKLYINGVLEGTTTSATAPRNAPTRITIGEIQTNINRFAGSVDELRIWNKVLTAPEILAHKDCEISNAAAPLLSNYHFNQGDTGVANAAVITLTDASGNNHPGTLNNFTLAGSGSNWTAGGGVVSGTACTGAEANILANNINIADGQTLVSTADFTDFGLNILNAPLSRTFTIQNTGAAVLNISSIEKTGADTAKFAVTGIPASIPAGGSASFTLTFSSVTTGTFTATIHIVSNAAAAPDYDFAVKGVTVPHGEALNFDGVNDFVEIPYPVSGDFSVEYWMKTTAAGPSGTSWAQGNGLVDAEVSGVANDWGTSIVGSKLAFGIGNPDMSLFSTSNVNTGNWVHVAATWKQSSGQMKIYINGALEATTTGPTALRNAPTRITIGEIQTNINRFNGSLDEVRIWNRTLTQAEIQGHKDCEINTVVSGLASNYHFNQGDAVISNAGINTLIDASGNNRTGTLNNFALTGNTSNWVSAGGVIPGTTCTGSQTFVQGNGNNITDGQTTTSVADFTDFGPNLVNTAQARTYTLFNGGIATLNISSITVAGVNSSAFIVSGAPTTIAVGGSASFTVTFNTAAAGSFAATIHINSDASNAADFDFVVSGIGVLPVTGAALNFDGVNDFVNIPNVVSGDFSLEYWMKTSVAGPNGSGWAAGNGIVDAEMSGNVNDWGTSILGNKLAFGIGNPDVTLVSTSNVNTGDWVHVAATWKQATGQMKLYINGVQEGSATSATNLRSAPTRITIGEIQTNINRFNGSVDEVRIWNKVLSQGEILAHKDCEINITLPGLAANYHFNQGDTGVSNTSVNTLTDASGNSRTGTLNNFALTGSTSTWVAPGGVVSGTGCTGAYVQLQGNSNDIAAGQSVPSLTNFTDFGNAVMSAPLTRSFVILNNGTTSLNISGVTVTGANAAAFTISGAPVTVAAGASASFTATFTAPTVGTYTSVIHIVSNSTNAPDYDFAVQAAVILPVPAAALHFDGSNDYVNIPYTVSSDFSVEYWMKTTATGPSGTVWTQGNGLVDASVSGTVNDWGTSMVGNKLAFGIGNPDVTLLSTSAVNTGSWVHVAATWKQSTGQMRLYINGVQEAANTGSTNLRNAPTRITIGEELQTDVNRFNGTIDEVRIWNKALSQNDILLHKDCEISGALPALAANYHFNQGDTGLANPAVTTLTDLSGNNKTGTLNNFALNGATSNWTAPGAVTTGTACNGTQINIQGNNNDVTDGQVTPSSANFTDFGSNAVNVPLVRTFTIQNIGFTVLNVSSLQLTGADAAKFSLSGGTGSIAVGGIASFTLTFVSAASGTFSATVHVNSDGGNATDYDFAVGGITVPVGAALQFDGSNDFINIPHVVSSDFTVEYWIKTTMTGLSGGQWYNGNGIVDAEMPGVVNDWGTAIVGNKLAFGLGNPETTIFSSSAVNTGSWVHVAATWKQSTGQMKLYINGVQESTTTGPTNLRNAPTRITLGEIQTNINFFNGAMDELRIWNRVLSQSEIQAHKNCEIATSGSALIANYHFNQGNVGLSNTSVNTLTDATGNNKTGTLNNFALTGSTSNWIATGGVVSGTTCAGGQINVQGNATDITDGQITAVPANFTDFGNNLPNATLTRTFTIENIGYTAVTISSITASGANASVFTVAGVPATLAVGASASFTVSFTAAAPATYAATIHVNSDASNAGDYDFAIQGTTVPPGAALNFDGVNDFVNIPHVVSGDFSVEYWLKTTAAGPSGSVWTQGNGVVDASVAGTVNDWGTSLVGNKLAFGIGNPDITLLSTSAVNTGNWVHVAATWKQSTGQMKLYVNGVQEATATGSTNARNAPTRITIGELQTDNNRFNGSVDELRIWNKVLSQAEIQQHKDCEVNGLVPQLLAGYHFNQGDANVSNASINTLTDASGNGNTGTLNNFALSGTTSNWTAPGGVVSGTACAGAQANILGNNTSIADGQTTAAVSNFTNFGNIALDTLATRTYTIANIGFAALHISGITLTGANASLFSLGSAPATIAPGGTDSFTVSFVSSTAGTYAATVHVNSDATNAADYDFAIGATAVCTTIYPFYADNDSDGFGAGSSSLQCAANATTPPAGFSLNNTDCNDNNAAVWQSGTLYVDNDGDQYNNGTAVLCYGSLPAGYSLTTLGTDCDDNNAAAWQSATVYIDNDGDNYNNGTVVLCYGSLPTGYSLTTLGPDCNDSNAAAWQSGTLYVDNDGDNYDNGTAVVCYGIVPVGYSLTTLGSDCNDSNANAWQSGTLYADNDGDQYDNGTAVVCYGNVPAGYSLTTLGADCDDNNAAAWQSGTLYVDNDGDNYDNGTAVVCYGNIPAGYSLTTLGPDCNDNLAAIHVFCCPACVGIPSKTNKPGNAGAITSSGSATVCPGETRSYTVASIDRACYYIWSVPAGGTILSGDSTTSITVQFTMGFILSGAVSVYGQNSCGIGNAKSVTVKRGPAPAISGTITGTISGLCADSGLTYSVSSIPGLIYAWSLNPSTAGTITGGQGTGSVTVDFASGWTTGSLSVTATNGCGTGAAKTASLKSAPANPGALSGPAFLCPDSSAVYSVAPVYGATRYTWTAPKGASISDGMATATSTPNTSPTLVTSSNTVTVAIHKKSGSVTVVPGNDCDDAGSKGLKLTAACMGSRSEENLDDITANLRLAPNPAHEELRIMFPSPSGGDYRLSVFDASGKQLIQKSLVATEGNNEQTLDVRSLSPGIYLLMVRGEGFSYNGRFVVE